MKKLNILTFVAIIQFSLLMTDMSMAQIDTTRFHEVLNMSFEELMNLKIIAGSKFAVSAKEIPATTLVITQEDIRICGYTTINEIVENIPGFYTIDDLAFNGVVPGVRGYWSGNSRNIIILVNGIKTIDNYSSGYRLRDNPIPVEAIDRIEVIRGPMSVIYGSGAFYGVINIITDENDRSSISASFGSLNTNKIFLRIADNISDKFKYSFNGSFLYSQGMNIDLNNMGTNIPGNVPGNTNGRLENRETYLNFAADFNGFTFKTNIFENPREIYFFLPSASDGYVNRQSGVLISAGYKKNVSDMLSINSNIIYRKQVLRAEADYYDEDYYGKEHIETEGLEIELNTLLSFNERFDLTSGINCRMITDIYNPFDHPRLLGDSYNPGVTNTITGLDDNSNIISLAGFAQIKYNPFNKLNIVAGFGFEQNFGYDIIRINGGGCIDMNNYQELKGSFEQEKVAFIPRLAAIYSLNNKHTIKVLYGEAINSPSFQQNWTQFVFEAYGSTLKQEQIKTLELNYLAVPVDFININFSLFRNNLNQLITRTHDLDSAGNYITYNSNAGEMITNGLELLIYADLLNNLRTEISFTYQETDNRSKGFDEITKAYSPKLLSYIKASYKIKNISVGLTGSYVDGMETYWDLNAIQSDGSYGARIGQKVDAYFKLATNINIENIFNTGIYIALKGYNLLDEEIRYPTFTNNTWADKGTLGFGRKFMLTAGWKFSRNN